MFNIAELSKISVVDLVLCYGGKKHVLLRSNAVF